MSDVNDDWLSKFPGLCDADGELRRALMEKGQVIHAPAGARVFQPGTECGQYLFLVEGTVRVQMVAENGREIVLYRVSGGETCVMTTACLLAHENYGAEGMAETDITAVAISNTTFRTLLGASERFRDFVFSAYGERLADLMVLVEEVAFRRLDLRLADFLVKNQNGGTIETTHQALAVELGSVREVVSRVLKEFERRGWVKLARGRIEVMNDGGLLGYIDSLAV
jgi:CRP/FNR family transcriptional regulator